MFTNSCYYCCCCCCCCYYCDLLLLLLLLLLLYRWKDKDSSGRVHQYKLLFILPYNSKNGKELVSILTAWCTSYRISKFTRRRSHATVLFQGHIRLGRKLETGTMRTSLMYIYIYIYQ